MNSNYQRLFMAKPPKLGDLSVPPFLVVSMIQLDYNMSLIYSITCMSTQQVYIGSTEDLRTRWRTHRLALDKGTHHCVALQDLWTEHGEEDFVFLQLAEVDPDLRKIAEEYYITLYNQHALNTVQVPTEVSKVKHEKVTTVTKHSLKVSKQDLFNYIAFIEGVDIPSSAVAFVETFDKDGNLTGEAVIKRGQPIIIEYTE